MFLFLTFLAYKSLQLRGGHLVYLSRLNENWRVITRTNFLAMRREKHCTNPMFVRQSTHNKPWQTQAYKLKRGRGKSTAQTWCLRGEARKTWKRTRAKFQREPRCKHCTNPKFVRRSTYNKTRHIRVQLNREPRAKALHKPDVCEAKYA